MHFLLFKIKYNFTCTFDKKRHISCFSTDYINHICHLSAAHSVNQIVRKSYCELKIVNHVELWVECMVTSHVCSNLREQCHIDKMP